MNKNIIPNSLPEHTILHGDYEYQIEKVLGQGGFGIVYKAKNLSDGSYVAIKEYFPSQLGITRDSTNNYNITASSEENLEYFRIGLKKFKKEALALSKFKHPNIVEIIDYMSQFGTEFFVMPYEEGMTLKKHIDTFGKYPSNQILNLLIPILNGLKEMHKHNLYHRDIKPDNIFLRKEGMPMLIDFGAARQAVGEKSQDFTQLLTHGYAPPEQYETNSKKQGPWTDFYALSGTIYSLITGEKPSSAPDRIGVVVNKSAINPFHYPRTHEKMDEKLLHSLAKCMILERKERFQTAEEWLNYLFEKKETSLLHTVKRENGLLAKGHKLIFSDDCYIEILNCLERSNYENRYNGKYITSNSEKNCIFNEFYSNNENIKYSNEIINEYNNYALFPICNKINSEFLPRPYLVNDGVHGNYRIINSEAKTLNAWIKEQHRDTLDEDELINITLKILEYFKKCKNGKSFIHLGLSLDNILIDNNKQIITSNTGWADYFGKKEFINQGKDIFLSNIIPEWDAHLYTSNNKISILTDIYAIGIIMYRMMIGINVNLPLFSNRSEMFAEDKKDIYVKPNNNYSNELKTIVMKAIEINTSRRIQSAEEFIELLNNVSKEKEIKTPMERESFFKKLFK